MIADVVRSVCLALTIYGCLDISMPAATNEFISGREGGRFRYLTNNGLYVCVMTMIVGICRRHLNEPMFKRVHNFLTAIALPINFTVLIIYWPILLQDVNHFRRMEVYLKGGIVSTFTDLCQHLVPEIGLIVEILDLEIASSMCHRYALVLYGIVYYLFCIQVSKVNGLWPYPFLEKMSAFGRFGFFLSIILISLAVYEVMIYLLTLMPTIEKKEKIKEN
ncbi:hypothetical protein NGRA_2971 [Nosema granulosis]|uniref:Uncharacterized protein n=1 Tax=Nosema granulosis TaxID=83296 RepID=A0A9P6GYB2_9MICR|nr:hypothetical protein NGRA_2971 [Nosema granulosis]